MAARRTLALITAMLAVGLLLAGAGAYANAQEQRQSCNPNAVSSRPVTPSADANILDFEDLTARQQRVFERTLSEDTVPVDGELANELDGTYVRHENRTYLVEEVIRECGSDPVLPMVAMVSLLFGVGLAGFSAFFYRQSSVRKS